MDDFYRYIIRVGDSYAIMKDNEKFGTYRKLSDALYERDRLIKSDWNWDDMLQLEETENPYEHMKLPKYRHKYSYISKVSSTYMVYDGRVYKGTFNNKRDAYEYAEQFNGRVVKANEKYRVQKSIDGKMRYFGYYKTKEEAIKRRDELIEKGWIDD